MNQQSLVLNDIPKLAELTEITIPQRDDLYIALLNKFSPNYEVAKELLVAIIEQNQLSKNKFTCKNLVKTCNWFENKKPELTSILAQIDNLPNDWPTWEKISQNFYTIILWNV